MYSIIIPGRPYPWKAAKKGPNGFYSPSEMKAYQEKVRLCFLENYGEAPMIKGPVGIAITVYAPASTGDLTNIVKNCEDSLQGFAYRNDRQTVLITARRVETCEANWRVEVTVTEAEKDAMFNVSGLSAGANHKLIHRMSNL